MVVCKKTNEQEPYDKDQKLGEPLDIIQVKLLFPNWGC